MAATNFDFPGLPLFPDNVPTVPLLRINLKKLLQHDESELDRLWEACCNIGFFYLELQDLNSADHTTTDSVQYETSSPSQTKDIDGEILLRDADALFALGKQFFALPLAEKQRFDFRDQGSYFGYKGYGKGVIDSNGTRDRNEFYNTSKDYVLGVREALPEPDLLLEEHHRSLMRGFIERSHAVVTMLLRLLEHKLGLPDAGLTSLHRIDAVSGDQIRWVLAPPQEESDRIRSMGEHTDFGSVTLLFNRLGGLQVLPPGSHGWAYVRPLRGHCVVNLGDALVKFSAGILKSNLHRVVNPPGAQAQETRMSLVYFSRPEDEVALEALTSSKKIAEARHQAGDEPEEKINAKDWILRRALGRRVGGDFEKTAGTETIIAAN